jgi:hypothetical protein
MPISNSTDRFNGVIASLAVKVPCVVASDVDLVLSGAQTVNGIAVVADDRVLVMAQDNAVENGIYDVTSTAWNRSADFDGNRDVTENSMVVVGLNGQSPIIYRVSSTLPITIGSTAINFTIFIASEGMVVIEGDTLAGDDNSTTVLIFTDSNGDDQLLDPSLSQIIAITDDYTFVLGDKGKTASRTGSTAGVAVTIPAESSVDYRLGTFLAVNNDGSDDITIAITTDTLTWAADNTTGTRTIAPGGYAVMQKVADGKWKIAGKQIT